MASVVDAVSITHRYGGQAALTDVTFCLEEGELACLVGPSGAGKSTLIKLIHREMRPTSGQMWVDGLPAHSLPARLLPLLRRRLGVVFQDHRLLPQLTAWENVGFALRVTNLAMSDDEIGERATAALSSVHLGDRAAAFPRELSWGERQRVAMARAIVTEPRLILADEPTGNLDPVNAFEIFRRLEEMAAAGRAVLLATHNLELVERTRCRVITLEAGRIVDDAPVRRTRRLRVMTQQAARRPARWVVT